MISASPSVGCGEGWALLDATDASAVNNGELDVALVTPRSAPGVLDEPVVETRGLVSAVTDSEHGVVKSGAASDCVEHTARVVLPSSLVSLNEDGDGLVGEGLLHLLDAVGGDGPVLHSFDVGVVNRVVLASACGLGGA